MGENSPNLVALNSQSALILNGSRVSRLTGCQTLQKRGELWVNETVPIFGNFDHLLAKAAPVLKNCVWIILCVNRDRQYFFNFETFFGINGNFPYYLLEKIQV
jgi:hypothetical protein